MTGKANPEYMRRAIWLATQNVATGAGGPFGALVVREGKIVGEGINTVTASHDPTAYWARIDQIYYGASSADAGRAGFADAFLYDEFRKEQTARTLPATQLLGDEAWESFAAWIVSENKVEY